MAPLNGKCLYRAATIVAGLVAAVVAVSYLLNSDRGMPVVSMAALAIAATVWLIGWVGRHLLLGR
jgi:hypothetical protein